MISLLVYLLIFLIIFGLLYWVLTLIPLPPPVKTAATVIFAVIGVLLLIFWVLLPLAHGGLGPPLR